MQKLSNAIVFDSVPLISDKLLDLLKQFVENVEVHAEIKLSQIHLYNTVDFILIPSYMIRKTEMLNAIKHVSELPCKVIVTPVTMIPFEITEITDIKNHHVFLLKDLKESLVQLFLIPITNTGIFDLNPMIEMGLSKKEALETANIALPKLKNQLIALKNEHQNLGLEAIIEKLHSIHGMTNYCGLIKSKNKINALELNLKETKDIQEDVSRTQIAKLSNILNVALEHLQIAEELLSNNQIALLD